jgi:A/G-specific adenine glycosylase
MSAKRDPGITLDLTDSEAFRHKVVKEGIHPETFSRFQKIILSFYNHEGRDMPWRHTINPYHILVSEIMLQQTQVERVRKKYPEFITAFPTYASLANAPLHQVLAVWQGMGYNRRALALLACARKVMDEYNGILPSDAEVLETLPGIGHATACSIAAFAFNKPVVFIETNIRRVFIHFFFNDRLSVRDREIMPLSEQALYRENPRVWYWALMDYGAALKNAIPNPNRKSAHYTKQAMFKGSDRQIRGIVLGSLLKVPGQDEQELLKTIPHDPARVHRIIEGLVAEGFIARSGSRLAIRAH